MPESDLKKDMSHTHTQLLCLQNCRVCVILWLYCCFRPGPSEVSSPDHHHVRERENLEKIVFFPLTSFILEGFIVYV